MGLQAQTIRYVRPGASGANNGTDWNNAYTSLPSSLTRGAIYYIATGSYGSYSFDDPQSGTTTITIKKATVADHGTSTGWSDSYGTGTANFSAPFTFFTGYYVVDGSTRSADWRSGYGIKVSNSGSNKAIDMSPAATTGNTLRYIEVQGRGLDNSSHDDGLYGFGIQNLKIEYCYFHDFGRCPFLSGYCNGWTLQYNLIARNSSDPVYHSEGWAAQSDNNHTIRYNIWEDIEGTAYIVCLNRNQEVNVNSNWQIYGNVFCYSPGNPYNREGVGDGAIAVINNQVAQNWKIYNNSFINITTGVAGRGISSRVAVGGNWASGMPSNSGIQVYNNFWWKSDNAGHSLNACNSCGTQNNRYDQTPHGTETGMEVNNTASTSVFVNYAGKNFRLSGPTAAGTGLASPFNVDLLGLARGSDGVWDRGAYEYSGTGDTTPPVISGVSVSSLLGISAVINWSTSESATGSIQLGTSTSYGTVIADVNLLTVHATAIVGLLPGTLYHYRIVATDQAGNTTTSGDFTFTTALLGDTTAPTVSLTAPAASAVVSNTVALTATASDELLGSGMASVTFLVDGVSVGSDTSSPYSLNWNSLTKPNGSHTIQARAQDVAGNTATTTSRTITIQNPSPDTTAPTVSVAAPGANAVVSNTVTLTATAADNSGGSGIETVTFLMDGVSVGTDTSSPYSITWNSASVGNGSHSVQMRAEDVAGNITTSSPRTISVQNTTPGSIVGDWLFEEASGTTALDASGFGNNGTLVNGPVRVSAGRATPVLQFDGVNDHLRVPNSSSLSANNAVTISAWVQVSQNGQWQLIVGKLVAEGVNSYPYNDYSLLAVGGTGGFYARMAIATSSGEFVNADSSAVVSYDTWHHLVGVYNGSTLTIYVDGVAAGSEDATGTLKVSGAPLFVGRNGSGGDSFKGSVDDLRIYNRALSATEVLGLFNSMTITPPSNLRLLD